MNLGGEDCGAGTYTSPTTERAERRHIVNVRQYRSPDGHDEIRAMIHKSEKAQIVCPPIVLMLPLCGQGRNMMAHGG